MGHQTNHKNDRAILDIGILIGIRYTQFNGFYFCTEQCIFARTIIIVRIWRKIFIDILDQRVNSSYLFQLLCLSKFFYLFFIFTCVFNISYFYAKIDSQGSLVYPLKLSSGICPAATEFIFYPWAWCSPLRPWLLFFRHAALLLFSSVLMTKSHS